MAAAASASDLEDLARLHGAAGEEAEVRAFVERRLGGRAETDRTGSVTITFGSGKSHTLIAAGLDEPGFVVSGVTGDGYLRLQRLAEPSPSYQFDRAFVGQAVRVSGFEGRWLPGVVAAPSVHFDADRGSAGGHGLDQLWVDIGASSRAEAEAAGAAILDRVTLERDVLKLAGGVVSAPWISTRAGAAALLALADRLTKDPPEGQVTLAFVSQQYYHNAGLLAVLRRTAPDRVLLVRPGGREQVTLASIPGTGAALGDELRSWAEDRRLPVGRGTSQDLAFGPFGAEAVWPDGSSVAVLTTGPTDVGTAVEALEWAKLAVVAAVAARAAGVSANVDWIREVKPENDVPGPAIFSPEPDPLLQLLSDLVAAPGVSGAEEAVRAVIRKALPDWAVQRTSIDERGNLIVKLGADGTPSAVFIAHMDEIGYRLTRWTGDAEFSAQAQGGLDSDLFAWHPARVWAKDGPIPAISRRDGTVWLGNDDRVTFIDQGVGEGTPVTTDKRLQRLLGQRIYGRSLDDRVGCAALVEALRRMTPPKEAAAPVWFVFSVEEETGLNGAAFVAVKTRPQRVYAVDSLVTSDSPLEPKRIAHLKLGEGAAIRAVDSSGLTARAEVERVLALAKRKKIPVQVGVTSGGNDGARFTRSGAANIPLSFPLRYSHSAAETADLRDIRALTDLVEALAAEELATSNTARP